ncbi:UDP-glucose 4-epimerase GalE [Alicyclobacillus dauci]|uniref:UDP-glucose 4-epimerase n=1 Tax=Alicyclobacillus dauci TaxID=1475485 RepID=A0ABY6YZR0_9BACL|nr:UDP-glucose 4-epimerase GalE [Alicyclobacillus dauci]WAH35949.1 UDP-glucose 4-epimerase GalE [Alicyclobacillus dauci]
MSVLVTGGAGYIGSHTVAELVAAGESVVVVDNLQTGHRGAVLEAFNVPFYNCDIRDTKQLVTIMNDHAVDTVIHFAADSLVGESVTNPLKYYDDNVAATGKLLQAMVEAGVLRIVFSSTAAVYGKPSRVPISEADAKQPENPYGETKLAIERMFHWTHRAHGLSSISLRYFNAAGAHGSLPIGEDHRPESHLIPIILQVALGQRPHIQVFGDDYETPDGTCIRDYIHVMDLASAHRLAVRYLREHDAGVNAFNLGNGNGFSVNEVIEVARTVTGHPIPAQVAPRRAGDPPQLIADSSQAQQVLGWTPVRRDLATIISDAWKWHSSHPNGYDDSTR